MKRHKSVLGSIMGSISRRKKVPEFDDAASINSGRSRLSSMTVVDVSPVQTVTVPMPAQEEVEAAFSQMMEQLGGLKLGSNGKELGGAEKWQMVLSARRMQQQKQSKTPEQMMTDLKENGMEEAILQAFRVSVTSEPIAWIREFIELGGWGVFLQVAKSVAFMSEHYAKREKLIAEVVKAYKSFASCTVGLSRVVEDAESILVGALYLGDPNRLVRHAMVQLMAVFCLFKPPKSHHRLWGCLREASKLLGENYVCEKFLTRFVNEIESLDDSEPSPQKIRYFLDSMILLNALISTSDGEDSLRERVLFRNQLYRESLRKVLPKLYDLKELALKRQLDFFFEDMRLDNEAMTVEYEAYLGGNAKQNAMTDEEQTLLNSITKHMNFEPSLRRGYLRFVNSVVTDLCFSQIGLDLDVVYSQQLPHFDVKYVIERMEAKTGIEWKDKYETLERQKDLLEVNFAEQVTKIKRDYENQLHALQAKLIDETKEKDTLAIQVGELEKKLEDGERKRKESLITPISESFDPMTTEKEETIITAIEETKIEERPLIIEASVEVTAAPVPPSPPPAPIAFAPPPPPAAPSAFPGAPPPPPAFPGAPQLASIPLVIRKTPTNKMRPIQWQKIPDARITGTIWESMNDLKWEERLDYDLLEKNFCQARKRQPTAGEEEQMAKNLARHRGFLSNKIQTNLGIALNRLKCSPAVCNQALKRMDLALFDEQITAELAKIEVGQKEKEEIFKYIGEESDWSELPFAEQFLLHMYSLPFYEDRLRCINYKNVFGEWYNDIKQVIKHSFNILGMRRVLDCDKQDTKEQKFAGTARGAASCGKFYERRKLPWKRQRL